MRRFVLWALGAGMTVLAISAAYGQNFPSRPVRIVVPGSGGGGDLAARVLATALTGSLGQPVIVDNRPTGVIPGETVAKSAPDGHTLLLSGSGLWLMPYLQDNVPFDPIRDFSPVTLAVSSPLMLVVNPSLPAKSVKELIALARARPGELNMGSGASAGSPNHLAEESFKIMARVNLVRVPYKGGAAVNVDLISGQVQVVFSTVGGLTSHIKSGRVRALAVTSAEPSALAPGLPTMSAAGLPGYESITIYGLFAPGRTPRNIINKLGEEIAIILSKTEVKEKFFNIAMETVGSSPEHLADKVKTEMNKWGKLIKDNGIRAE